LRASSSCFMACARQTAAIVPSNTIERCDGKRYAERATTVYERRNIGTADASRVESRVKSFRSSEGADRHASGRYTDHNQVVACFGFIKIKLLYCYFRDILWRMHTERAPYQNEVAFLLLDGVEAGLGIPGKIRMRVGQLSLLQASMGMDGRRRNQCFVP
jgi:hypothetical protein